jgi:hypothetical protein
MPLTRQQKAYKVNLPPLSPQHRDALYGMLLGNACVTRCRGPIHACIQFDQSAKQAAFVDHLFQLFRDWTRSYHGRSFRTFAHTTFTAFDAAFHPGTGSSGTRESETQEDLFTAILTVQNRKNESLFMKNETYITINAH